MEKKTYWQILKSSKRFFTNTPIAFDNFTKDMTDGVKTAFDGISEIIAQLIIFTVWFSILITFPITIPVSAAFIYLRQNAHGRRNNGRLHS